jgi:molybdopterin-guanine dinucleotide biosynthesis protein A
MEKHKKHGNLIKRKFGNFAPNEIAILGTKCSIISDLVQNITKNFKKSEKIAYLDASHNNEITAPEIDNFTFHNSGNLIKNSETVMNRYNDKMLFSNYDFLFINGNHYQAEQQILILDCEKESSVLKRIEQLKNVQFLILKDKNTEIFDFLIEKYPELKNLNVYLISEIDKIASHVENLIFQKTASIHGLVLAGGKSLRMGTDKGLLDYFGKSQRNYTVELLERLNLKTYLSVRKEQNVDDVATIEDAFLGLGPFGAICSAFQSNPNTAWLVLATDLPFVDEKIIQLLLEKRNSSKIATTIKGKNKKFPEPLITIWEPKSYPILLNYLSQGISCPRKVLINNDVEIIEIDDDYIINVNTPDEFEAVKKELND